jgi:DNA-binding NtrC family response regulator
MLEITGFPRVLVVDDESIIADTLVLILNKSGYEATAAYSGEQALELAPVIEPHVLISDVAMKGANGIETAIRITNELPKCKVVLFSGQAHAADLLEEARTQGYNFEILRKPVDPRVLLNHIRSLLNLSEVKATNGTSKKSTCVTLVGDNATRRAAAGM